MFLDGELGEIDVIFWRGYQVAELSQFGLERDGVEEFEEVDVGRVGFEVFFQEEVYAGFEQEGVVDGDHADGGLFVPARLAAARYAAVHYVVGDEKEGLEELGEPAEGGG